MSKSKLSVRGIIMIMVLPLVVCLALVVGLLAFMTKQTYSSAEELYFQKLYTINSNLLAADRDFYQAMFANSELQVLILQNNTTGEMENTVNEIYNDYEENAAQAIDMVHVAIDLAKTDSMLYTGITTEDGLTFEQLGQNYEELYSQWFAAYSPRDGSGAFQNQNNFFFNARDCLDKMQEITNSL